jgi:cytochrome c-type biogenesis protein CcmH
MFWLICVVLIALALAFILPPLRRSPSSVDSVSVLQANLSVYRNQIAELESARRDGVMTTEQVDLEREEIETRLLSDLPAGPQSKKTAKRPLDTAMLAYAIAVGLPLAALLLYLKLGSPP